MWNQEPGTQFNTDPDPQHYCAESQVEHRTKRMKNLEDKARAEQREEKCNNWATKNNYTHPKIDVSIHSQTISWRALTCTRAPMVIEQEEQGHNSPQPQILLGWPRDHVPAIRGRHPGALQYQPLIMKRFSAECCTIRSSRTGSHYMSSYLIVCKIYLRRNFSVHCANAGRNYTQRKEP